MPHTKECEMFGANSPAGNSNKSVRDTGRGRRESGAASQGESGRLSSTERGGGGEQENPLQQTSDRLFRKTTIFLLCCCCLARHPATKTAGRSTGLLFQPFTNTCRADECTLWMNEGSERTNGSLHARALSKQLQVFWFGGAMDAAPPSSSSNSSTTFNSGTFSATKRRGGIRNSTANSHSNNAIACFYLRQSHKGQWLHFLRGEGGGENWQSCRSKPNELILRNVYLLQITAPASKHKLNYQPWTS